jgi:hypothetical protein
MRDLTMSEIGFVSGAGDDCPGGDSSGNNYGGITETTSVGQDIINLYEGLVAATSHIIERVAGAL